MARKVELTDAQMDMALVAVMTSHCDIDHTNDPAGPNPRAVNTLMIPRPEGILSLHLCKECYEALEEKPFEWFLYICFNCISTKWMHREFVRHPYKEQIIGVSYCPNCKK